ncbi:hypothetical protein N7478_000795 [Penicillium angulare]|uniref:uncharacterized protein n=1 Tax=Penicillium angulare TaxID=116970 RepID=UPI002541E901|nr:uncharacterized protein N7478_000795 [Penicillium angulare]KAJ5291544.1 hypothetical protein N7478_000795 [Penicillium angulare]
MAFTQKQRLKDAGLKAIQEAPEEEDWTKYWEQLDDLPDLHEPGILVNSQYLDQRHGLRTFSGISHPMLGVIGAMIAFLYLHSTMSPEKTSALQFGNV